MAEGWSGADYAVLPVIAEECGAEGVGEVGALGDLDNYDGLVDPSADDAGYDDED